MPALLASHMKSVPSHYTVAQAILVSPRNVVRRGSMMHYKLDADASAKGAELTKWDGSRCMCTKQHRDSAHMGPDHKG